MAIPPSQARASVVSWECSDETLVVDFPPDTSCWDLLGFSNVVRKMGGLSV